MLRALALLFLVLAASAAATWYFGADILIALGLILVQIKVLWGKLMAVQLPSVLAWLKTETASFFRVELIKKYFYGTFVPLLLGAGFRRWTAGLVAGLTARVRVRYDAMMAWYRDLDPGIRLVAGIIVVVASLGASVSLLGLWLILFSVQLPFWLVAFVSASLRSVWASLAKYAFKTVAFLHLGWLWRLIARRLPAEYLDAKRRLDFRVARTVVRQRRMTLRQLEAGGRSLGFRIALLRAYIRADKPDLPDDMG